MNKKTTILIEDADSIQFRTRLNKVLSRYTDDRIFNIDTGMVHNKYDSRGNPQMYYYAVIIVRGDAMKYDYPEEESV